MEAILDIESRTHRDLLADLYSSYSGSVYGFVIARCGSAQLAEDLTGDTFVAAAATVARGDGATINGSWLITVARRRLIDHWRRIANYQSKIETVQVTAMGIPASEDRVVERARVEAALESLPNRQRAALALRYLEDWSISEIAELLNTSYRAAESLLARARVSFSAAYEAEEETP